MQFQKWLIRIFIAFLVAAIAAPVGFVLLLILGYRWELQTRYDRDGPNYLYVTEKLGSEIDFERFNDGDWQLICVIGAYNDPVKVLAEQAARRGVDIANIDPVETRFLGITPIEETEGAVSFVDRFGRGRTVLIDGFERLMPQHGVLCVGRETSRLKLPVVEEPLSSSSN